MVWYGRPHDCGSWLPVDKKLRCGMDGKMEKRGGRVKVLKIDHLNSFFTD